MNVGEGIRLLREREGYSARALSLKCQFSASYVGKVESGEIDPSVKAFAKLAIELKLSSQEIIYLIMEEAKGETNEMG